MRARGGPGNRARPRDLSQLLEWQDDLLLHSCLALQALDLQALPPLQLALALHSLLALHEAFAEQPLLLQQPFLPEHPALALQWLCPVTCRRASGATVSSAAVVPCL